MRKAFLISTIIISFIINSVQAESGNFKEVYEAKDVVKIETDIGSLILSSNSSDKIEVECDYDMDGNLLEKQYFANVHTIWKFLCFFSPLTHNPSLPIVFPELQTYSNLYLHHLY